MSKIKIPKNLKDRLDAVAKNHGFESRDVLAAHFVERGLKQFTFLDAKASVDNQIEHVVEERGYSSDAEVIEHLLLRGLRAYEENQHDPKKLEERLRGLGYID
jgi:metal-responsive CopG/Arc/MetJ family transcriptional regulator